MTSELSPSPFSRAHSFPWETLTHIISYADQATLVSLCLVSFTVWEIARPILYEEIEISKWKTLISLLYTVVPSSSTRLPSSRSRIGTLTLRLPVLPFYVFLPEYPTFEYYTGHPPHATSSETGLVVPNAPPRPTRTLIFASPEIGSVDAVDAINLVLEKVFPRINPEELICTGGPSGVWATLVDGQYTSNRTDPPFVEFWTSLRRLTYQGYSWSVKESDDEDDEEATPFSTLWLRRHRRSLEIVLDFATGQPNGYLAWRKLKSTQSYLSLERILIHGGINDSNIKDGEMVLRVGVENEEEARKDVGELELELRRKVRVEVVGGEE